MKIICFFIGHDWGYWDESLDKAALIVEFQRCLRCDKFNGVTDVIEK